MNLGWKSPGRLARVGFFVSCCLGLTAAVSGQTGNVILAPEISEGVTGTFTALLPDGRILADQGTVRYNADGSIDPTYSLAGTSISAIAVTTGGNLFIFGSAADQSPSLKIYTSNGVPLGAQPVIASLSQANLAALPNGQVLLWTYSAFTVGGITRNGVARFNSDGSLDLTFDPGRGASGQITAVAAQADGKLLLAGNFNSFDGVAVTGGLVRLNGDGTVDQTFAAPSGNVGYWGLLALPSGKILTTVFSAGTGAEDVVLLNANGSLNSDYGSISGLGGDATAFALQSDGKILVAGSFTTFAGYASTNLVRLNPDGSVDPTFNATATMVDGSVSAISQVAVQNDGHILYTGGSAQNLSRLNADGSPDPLFFQGANAPGQVQAVTKSPDNRTFLAGVFLSVDGTNRAGLACLRSDGSIDPSFVPSGAIVWRQDNTNLPVTAQIAVALDDSVWLVGSFTAVGNESRPGIAHFLPNGSLDSAVVPALSAGGSITSVLALPDGRVVVGGTFTSINSVPRTNLAAFGLNGDLDPTIGVADGPNGAVTLLALRPSGGFYFSGNFTTAGTLRRDYVAALQADGTVDPSFSTQVFSAAPISLAVLPDGQPLVASNSTLLQLSTTGTTDFTYTLPNVVGSSFMGAGLNAVAVDPFGRTVLAVQESSGSNRFPTITDSLIRLDATGNLDPTFPSGLTLSPTTLNYPLGVTPVLALAAGSDGSVAAAGTFTSAGSAAAGGLLLIPNAAGAVPGSPTLISSVGQNQSQSVKTGSVATFSVAALGSGLTYQWQLNGVNLPEGTGPTFALNYAGAADQGTYSVVITGSAGSTTATVGTLTVTANAWLSNLSTRAPVQASPNDLIAGWVTAGTAPKTLLIRGVGPELAKSFGVANALPDPQLTLYAGNGSVVSVTTGWAANLAAAFASVYAFPLTVGSADTAILPSVAPGSASAEVVSATGQSGVALIEIYDTAPGDPINRLINLSSRALVRTGGNILIGGFVIGGTTSETLLIRGIGPELARTFGIVGALVQPQLALYDSKGVPIATAAGWSSPPTEGPSNTAVGLEAATAATMAQVSAFPLPVGSGDSAFVVTLPPGAYSAEVSGVGSTTGVGLVEIYEVR